MQRKVILYIAMSLDGYIAGPDDDLTFLESVQQEGEDYDYAKFLKTVDTVILGRKTYDWVMKQVPVFPYADKTTYVISRTARESIGNIHFFTNFPSELALRLKKEEGKDIFCVGGGEIVNDLLDYDLIDEMIISIIPVLIGDGVALFSRLRPEQKLELISSKQFEKGLVQLHYLNIKAKVT